MPNLDQFWKQGLLWNSVGAWMWALVVFLAVFIGLLALRQIFRSRRRKWLEGGRPLPVALDLTAQLIEKTTPVVHLGCGAVLRHRAVGVPANQPSRASY